MSVGGVTAETERTTSLRIAEMFFLDRAPTGVQVAAPVMAGLVAAVSGIGLERAHRHFAAVAAAGDTLNPVSALLASGSSAATAWPGWVAGLFFAIALLRLHRGPAEPPAGRGNAESRSVADLRLGLRNEYTSVRMALVVVAMVALIDATRCVIAITGATADATPPATLAATLAEVLGLVVAAVLLGAWAWSFRGELERWGAI